MPVFLRLSLLSRFAQWLLAGLCLGPLCATILAADVAPLTTAAQVRALTEQEAGQARPVRLRGVFMGDADPAGIAFVLQDESEGIYVQGPADRLAGLSRGDLLELDGVTDPGGFAPYVIAHRIQKVGRSPIPEPLQVTLDELNAGQMDAKWVEISGIVRSVEPKAPSDAAAPPPGTRYAPPAPGEDPAENRRVKIKLAAGSARVTVELDGGPHPEDFVDAEVRLRGLCFNLHNRNRQFVRPFVQVPRGVAVILASPPPEKPFRSQPSPVSSIFRFEQLTGKRGHRVHVRGVVLHHQPGAVLWLRDGDDSLRVETNQTEALQPGDEIDVVGYPARIDYSAELEDAVFRRRSTQPPPPPEVLTDISSALRNDADLVQLEGRLTEVRRFPELIALTVDWQGAPVRAQLRIPENAPAPADWLPGSLVRLSGICSVKTNEAVPLGGLWEPRAFELLLRSPTDLALLHPAPWWNLERVVWMLSSFLAVAVGSIALVSWASRRRLKEQDHRRAMAETEFAAILSERNRVAREIHDTLSQNLGAISVQLELARTLTPGTSAAALNHIAAARNLARAALADARDSIWNMRSHVLERCDLGEALEGILARMTEGTAVTPDLQVEGDRRRLPPVIENNLLRIGQEAITNASKYAQANRISVHLHFAGRVVRLAVTDDGVGFRPEPLPPGHRRSFGLVGIKERAELLGGTAQISSAPGQGTSIVVTLSV